MTKLCKDCVHCDKSMDAKGYDWHYWKCISGHNLEINPVVGEGPIFKFCEYARQSIRACGPDGKWWMPNKGKVESIYEAAISAAKHP